MRFKKFIRCTWNQVKIYIEKIQRETKKLLVVALAAVLMGAFLGAGIGIGLEKKTAEEQLAETVEKMQTEEEARINALQEKMKRTQDGEVQEIPWNLVLVNQKNPMEEGYEPEFTEIEPDYYVDSRIADAAKKMLRDSYKAGVRIDICSAYRSVERQEQVFEESLRERLNQGMDYWEAFNDNRKSVAEPGTSEHALGLALDLISNQYTKLDEGQENTKEAKWLKENCYKYGFILRYPPEKTDITGIVYEPWHYRYVGVEDATKIMELGITLEEYLETYY